MDNIKLIISDIDYTLTDETKMITKYNLDIFKECIKRGIVVCLCSGRSNSYVLDITKDINYIISSNGSLIYNVRSDEYIYKNEFSDNDVIRSINLANKYNIDLLLNDIYKRYSNNIKACIYDKNSVLYNNEKLCVTQIIPNSNNYNNLVNFYNEFNINNEYYYPNYSNNIRNKKYLENNDKYNYWFDIIKVDESKGKGINYLQKYLGIKKEDTICFGDNVNDLAMFNECGVKVAVNNAIDEVKEIADYICDDSKNNGVGKFINDNILNN